jgi:pimeloyl-ACP methyl ester carboxylesterase
VFKVLDPHRSSIPRVLMLPGFGGRADQPILVQLEAAIRPLGLSGLRASLPRARPSPGFEREVETARILGRSAPRIVAYVGRSFGGRVLARLALESRPRALVLLGFPVRSQEGRRRHADEAVLEQLCCPTLIVQGSKDPLGPVRTFERLAEKNRWLELEVIPNATHTFGRSQKQAVMAAAGWLARRTEGRNGI